MAAHPSFPNLTSRDIELAVMAWEAFVEDPKLDFDKFAKRAGFGSTASARASFNPVKKKLLEGCDYVPRPKNQTPRKRAKPSTSGDDGDNEVDEHATPTPSKKPRAGGKKKQPSKKAAAAAAPAAAPADEDASVEDNGEA